MYLIGLFIMTAGIAVSVKSNLGVSPVSSIPYTMTCVWGIEMGKATITDPAAAEAVSANPVITGTGGRDLWLFYNLL